MLTPKIACPKCKGSGHFPLSKVLLRTFVAIDHLESCTIPEIEKHLGEKLSPGSINQRVKKLVSLGIVAQEKRMGKLRAYRVV